MPQTDLETMLARRASSAVTTGDWVLLKAIANCLIELETVRLVTGASRDVWNTQGGVYTLGTQMAEGYDPPSQRVREVPLINVPMRDEQPRACLADGGALGTCQRVRGHSQEHENAEHHWS